MKLVGIKKILKRRKNVMSNECTTCCNEGCQSCQLCDSGCQEPCDSCESFCETGGQNSSNNFSFSACVSSGQIIGVGYFDRGVWNEAIDMINSVFSEGSKQSASSSKINRCNNDLFITANEFERVAGTANYYNVGVGQNKVIYGLYYEELENAVANLNYKWGQCDQCNVDCDKTCDKCETCDGGCDGCDSECGNYCCDCCDNDCCDNDKTEEGGDEDEGGSTAT